MTILLKPVYRYLQKRSHDWSGSAALSTLLLALFLVMHQSVAAEAPKPQEPTAATTNSETSAAPAETNATPAEASFKLDAYLNKKAIQTILASGQLEAFPELMLTADIQKAPLRKVLAVLAREAKLKVYVADNVPDDNISVKFDELPLEEGIKQILKEQNYMLTRVEIPPPSGTKIKKSFMKVTEIRILPRRGEASGPYQLQEVTSAPRKDDKDEKRKPELKKLVQQALKADKAEDRLAAFQKFAKEARETDDEWADIEPTLKDGDERVRKAALPLGNVVGDVGHEIRMAAV